MMLLATLLVAQAVPQPPAPVDDIVVVVGQRLERELAACLARDCPPAQDVEASLQASVTQFGEGRYADARRTLQAAIRRNAAHAATLPGPVSSLYATLANVAQHDGDVELWRRAAHENVAVLRTHLGPADPATLREELVLADTLLRTNTMRSADVAYARIERLAERSHPAFASAAAFRRAALLLMRGRLGQAERLAARAVALGGASDPIVAETAAVIAARLAVARGDPAAVDALVARLRQSPNAALGVVELPPRNREGAVRLATPLVGTPFMGPQQLEDRRTMFADVGYRIRPDGRTEDAAVLRGSGIAEWQAPILRQVAERRYRPLDLPAGHPGVYRIDRFTIRAARRWITTGSRIANQRGVPEVHVADLTATQDMVREQRARVAAPAP